MSKRRYIETILFQLTVLAFAAFPAHGASPDDDAGDLQELVLAGVRRGHNRLRSGVVTVRGSVKHEGGAHPDYYADGRIEMLIAFDIDANRLRFDRFRPGILVDADDPTLQTPVSMGGKLISRADQTLRWHRPGNDVVRIEPPGWPKDAVIKPFDVRAVGFVGWSDLDRGTPWDSVLDILQRPVSEIEVRDERYYELIWSSEAGSTPHRVLKVFDTEQGFSPVRWELRLGRSADGEWLKPREVVTTEWKESNGAWVPVSLHQEQKWGPRAPRIVREFDFEWKNVNEPVDDEYFTMAGLDLPAGTMRMASSSGSERRINLIGTAFNDEARGPYLETRETIVFITSLDAWPEDVVGRKVSVSGIIRPRAIRDGEETFDAYQLQTDSWTRIDDESS